MRFDKFILLFLKKITTFQLPFGQTWFTNSNALTVMLVNIGETSRHIKSRIEEHTRTDKMSQVYKYLHGKRGLFH